MIALRPLYDKNSPVDTDYPAHQIDSGEELEETDCELGFVHVLVAEARTKHCARTRYQYVEDQADVRPDILQLRHISDKFQSACVRLGHRKQCCYAKVHSVFEILLTYLPTLEASLILRHNNYFLFINAKIQNYFMFTLIISWSSYSFS